MVCSYYSVSRLTFAILPQLNGYLHVFPDRNAGAICFAVLICKIEPLSLVSFSNSEEKHVGKGLEIRIMECQDLCGPEQAYINSSHGIKE